MPSQLRWSNKVRVKGLSIALRQAHDAAQANARLIPTARPPAKESQAG